MKVQDIIKTHTTEDGTTDWGAVETALNETVNGIVVKTVAKEREKAQGEYLKALGFDSEDDLRKKLSEDGKTEVLKQLDTIKTEYEELKTKHEPLSQKATSLEREKHLYKLGITDEDAVDYIVHAVGKRTNETTSFEDALKAFQEEKPQVFKTGAPFTTTGSPSGGGVPAQAGYEKYLAEKHPDLFKDD